MAPTDQRLIEDDTHVNVLCDGEGVILTFWRSKGAVPSWLDASLPWLQHLNDLKGLGLFPFLGWQGVSMCVNEGAREEL